MRCIQKSDIRVCIADMLALVADYLERNPPRAVCDGVILFPVNGAFRFYYCRKIIQLHTVYHGTKKREITH